jgi:subfamily B ATP-binding cassette protein MsbA
MLGRAHGSSPSLSGRGSDKEPPVALGAVDWRRLIGHLKPYRGRMAVAIVAMLASAGLGLSFPLIIVRLLDSVTRSHSLATLNSLAMLLVGVFLAQAAFSFLQSNLLATVGERIVRDLRTRLYRHLHSQSLEFFGTRRVGEIVSRLSSDVTQMRTVLTSNVTSLLSQTVSVFGALAIVIRINVHLTLFIFALMPVLIAVGIVFGKRIQKASVGVQDDLAASTVVAEEALQGIREVKSFVREKYETERYEAAVQKAYRASLRMAVTSSLFGSVMMFLGFASIAAIVRYGGAEVIAGRLTLAMISGFLMYGIAVAGGLAGLAGVYGQFRGAIGGVQRIFEILDTQPAVRDAADAIALPPLAGRIEFDDVSFQYEANAPVLRGITMDIEPGEILALVGPSGAGKSTMFNLIPRFYDPTAGGVRIDGHDLRSVKQESLREQIALVPQECILFGGTIRENILYGRLDATEEELMAASRAANAHEFIMSLPSRYETVVGERGTKLSGGQRQRIAIARALLKDPRILLLDEATSSLDSESEALVQEALNRLMVGRTTVIIAHRLSTVRAANRLAVLDAGQIVELGSHEELIRQDGLYARLYSMQFRDADVDTASRAVA